MNISRQNLFQSIYLRNSYNFTVDKVIFRYDQILDQRNFMQIRKNCLDRTFCK